MLRRVWTRFALLAAVCAATGCNPTPGVRTPLPTNEPTLGTLALPVAPPLTLPAVPALDFRPCSGAAGLQCATMTVPLDYADPSGQAISIAVTRLPSISSAQGSIVVNPGGPGESGIDYLNAAAGRFTSLRASYNVVSFDPRGTGRSEPAHCLPGADLDQFYSADPIANTAESQATLVALSQRFAAGCLTRTGRALLFLGTQYTARDLEELRRALGGAPLTYLGLSYGTFLGETYASLYPDKVRAMVLDGVENPTIPLLSASEDQATAFEHDLTDFERGCARGCGFSRPPAVAIADLLAQAARAPLIVNGRPLTRAEAITGILTYLYEPAEDRNLEQALANAINQAASGNGELLLGSADDYIGRHSDGTYGPLAEANVAVACADSSVPTTLSTFISEARRMNAIDPLFGAATVWGDLLCAYWPFHAPPASFHTVETAPLLFVGATGDPATPYKWALGAVPFFPGSILLTRDGDGHVSFGKSTCADAYEQAYLVKLTLPPPGTTCPTN